MNNKENSDLPLYLKVQYDLEKRIRKEGLGSDGRALSEIDFCKHYDVSRTTVRQAVDELVRVGLMRRERGRGTFVCQIDSPLVPESDGYTGTTNRMLGLIMPYLPDSLGMQIIASVEQEARKFGYRVLYRNTGNDPAVTIADIDELFSIGIDGVITYPSDTHPCDDVVAHLLNKGMPFCLLDQRPMTFSCNSVTSNNFAGGRTAGNYLLQLKHKAIGFVSLNLNMNVPSSVHDRILGMKDACREAGLPLSDDRVFLLSSRDISPLVEAINKHDITGIVTANDMMGAFLINELIKYDLRVPEDVSLISFDNSPVSQYTFPPLTTIAQNGAELGVQAARTVIDCIEGRLKEVQQIVLAMELVIRGSTTVNRSAYGEPQPSLATDKRRSSVRE